MSARSSSSCPVAEMICLLMRRADAHAIRQIFEFRLDVGAIVTAAAVVPAEVRVIIGIVAARCRIGIWIWIRIGIRVRGLIGGTLVNLAAVFIPLVVIIVDDFRVFHGRLSAQKSARWCHGSGKRAGVMANQTFYSLKQQGSAGDSSGRRQCALQKSSTPARRLRDWRRITVRLRLCGLCGLRGCRRGRGRRRGALWLGCACPPPKRLATPARKLPPVC